MQTKLCEDYTTKKIQIGVASLTVTCPVINNFSESQQDTGKCKEIVIQQALMNS